MLRVFWLLTAGALILMAADPAWKSKPPAAWTEEDARQVLTDSPWAKPVKGTIGVLQTEDQRREGGNMGQPHGVGFDGLPDDRPRVQAPKNVIDIVKPESASSALRPFLTLQLRWESALPVRVAELKANGMNAPTLEEDGYTLAVYGIPGTRSSGDPKTLGEPLKKQAVLKRDGKKDVRPSTVKVLQRDERLIVIYVFPLSAEISKNDGRIEFEAQIGRIALAESFVVEEMQWEGKLQL